MEHTQNKYLQETVNEILKEQFEKVYDEVTCSDFELLSTIRYDPHLSQNIDADKTLSSISKSASFLWSSEFSTDFGSPFSTLQSPSSTFNILPNPVNTTNATVLPLEDLESLYYNRFFLLGEHFKRIQFTLLYFKWDCAITLPFFLRLLVDALPSEVDLPYESKMNALINNVDCYKMRVLINSKGKIRVEAHTLAAQNKNLTLSSESEDQSQDYFLNTLLSGFLNNPPTWTVYIYDKPLIPSPFTSFKTTKRDHYNLAREKLTQLHQGKTGPAEILLFNSNRELMEGSITNCYVKRNEDNCSFYETPALSSGCLTGVMRHFLVSKRVVKETKNINIDSLKNGDEVLLSNGIMGLVKGIIVKDGVL